MRILLVEDDAALADTIARALRSQGWAVDWTARGEPVVLSLQSDPYDLLMLDIGLAGIDGYETLRRVRMAGLITPVLMLTARDAIEDRVRGLEGGADDYLTKPFALEELLARVKALVRRNQASLSTTLTAGTLSMDLNAKRVFIDGRSVEFSAREWAVLEHLLQRHSKVVSKEAIIAAIAGWDELLSENAVEVYVSRLRSKIDAAGVRIRTVRGFGYILESTPTDAATQSTP